MRVQIPAYTDRWMMGDRFGEIVRTTRKWEDQTLPSGKVVSTRCGPEIAHVRLDKSHHVVRVLLNDCTPID